MLCRYLCLHGYFTLSRKKLQGRFREKSVKTDFPAFLSTFPRLVDFFGVFWDFCVFWQLPLIFTSWAGLVEIWIFPQLNGWFWGNFLQKIRGYKNCFYSISGASCIFRASVIYAGKEALQPFSATFPGHVEIFERAVILNTDFLPLR